MRSRQSESAGARVSEARETARAGSLRGVLRALMESFDTGGIGALREMHLSSLGESRRYRALYRLARFFLPITPLLSITADLERLVGELGVHGASRITLARPPIPWVADMPAEGKRVIRSAPLIVYGIHGSILTPLLLAAAIDRPDLKMIAASYIAKLGPNIADCSFPVFAAAPVRVKRAGRKGLVPRAMGWIAWKSEGGMAPDDAREKNRDSLRRAAAYVRQGGGLLIAPEPRDHRKAWRAGIGLLVADLARDGCAEPVYLVPWNITGASITGIFQLLSRNPFARYLGKRRFRRPVRVALGTPMTVEFVVSEAGHDPLAISSYLERDYRERRF